MRSGARHASRVSKESDSCRRSTQRHVTQQRVDRCCVHLSATRGLAQRCVNGVLEFSRRRADDHNPPGNLLRRNPPAHQREERHLSHRARRSREVDGRTLTAGHISRKLLTNDLFDNDNRQSRNQHESGCCDAAVIVVVVVQSVIETSDHAIVIRIETPVRGADSLDVQGIAPAQDDGRAIAVGTHRGQRDRRRGRQCIQRCRIAVGPTAGNVEDDHLGIGVGIGQRLDSPCTSLEGNGQGSPSCWSVASSMPTTRRSAGGPSDTRTRKRVSMVGSSASSKISPT